LNNKILEADGNLHSSVADVIENLVLMSQKYLQKT